jgi:hypothetical protein
MSNSRHVLLQLVLGPALVLTLMPSGCAVGVEPEFEDLPLSDAGSSSQAGGGNGGSAGKATGGGGAGAPSTAGTTSTSGSGANPFGGSAGSGGQAGQGGKGGSTSGGASGGAGKAGSAGAGGAGGTTGGCSCAKTLAWMDDTVMNWATGDCVTSGGVTYRYVGTKAQTYANGDCNPAKQEPWCSDSGNDYKFMACP